LYKHISYKTCVSDSKALFQRKQSDFLLRALSCEILNAPSTIKSGIGAQRHSESAQLSAASLVQSCMNLKGKSSQWLHWASNWTQAPCGWSN